MNPQWTMEVGENFDKYTWYAMAEAYVNSLKLKFVKTAKELQAEKNETPICCDCGCDCEDCDPEKKYIG
jgi:hypothetical protein